MPLEYKAFFANEGTFLSWLNFTGMVGWLAVSTSHTDVWSFYGAAWYMHSQIGDGTALKYSYPELGYM
jgi:hypothetical protein